MPKLFQPSDRQRKAAETKFGGVVILTDAEVAEAMRIKRRAASGLLTRYERHATEDDLTAIARDRPAALTLRPAGSGRRRLARRPKIRRRAAQASAAGAC